ncbi:MAG TPA: F0F1 ATP synthase subunit B [Anaerolineales bacterium]|nr:F0F1 ATP synthase subunit B [Anaerolineales bacterium]
MEALGINGGYFLVQLVNFLIIAVVVNTWIVKPVVGLLEKRREKIAQGLEDARVAAEARANAEKEAEKVLADAQLKANEVVREATARAESAAKDLTAAAEADAERLRAAGRTEADQEKVRVLGDVRGQVATLAMAAAQKLVGDALDEARQRTLIEEFFSGVRAGRVTILEDASVSGTSAVVTSALPLTEGEQTAVRRDVLARLDEGGTVEFKVDPSILGGLVVRVGDKVLDGSVSGKLSAMAETLR